jgi:hypothetical protein
MSNDPFSDPGKGGDRLDLNSVNGALLLFDVISVEHGIETTFGPSDAVKCDVACLDGDHKGETWDGTLIFPRVLQGQLSGKVGGKVLGRLGQGVAKPGQSPPWTLADPTDADRDTGRAYLAHLAKIEDPF